MALMKCHECGADVSTSATACTQCGAKTKKRTSSVTWIVGAVVMLTILTSVVSRQAPSRPISVAPAAAKSPETRIAECRANNENQRQEYADLVVAHKNWAAAAAIRVCADLLADPEMRAMVAAAETRSYFAAVNDSKASAAERRQAVNDLMRDYPEAAQASEEALRVVISKLDKEALLEEQKRLRDEKKRALIEAAQRRKAGVQIGMSKEEVLASSWGRPQHVNTTTYSFGVHEQWVYGGNNYLYFQDGKLTSIQN